MVLVVGMGCSGASGTDGLAEPGEPGGSAAGGQGGASGAAGSGAGNAGSGGQGPLVDPTTEDTSCGDVGKVIFVVSDENVLLKFDPATSAFSVIGTLKCPAGFGDTPFSMAVDRAGVAFVLYQSGNIFKVRTTDAACAPSGYKAGQLGWQRFGMGYVSDTQGSSSETLYVIDGTTIGGGNEGLGLISHQGQLQPVGQFTQGLGGRTAEVTGRGDGRLFAFFVGDAGQSSVAEIDKTTGATISNEPQALPSIQAWAFAHWGGSFYLFNASSGSSRVHRYTPGKGTTQILGDVGYRIVGAGVSTCAPTTPVIE